MSASPLYSTLQQNSYEMTDLLHPSEGAIGCFTCIHFIQESLLNDLVWGQLLYYRKK